MSEDRNVLKKLVESAERFRNTPVVSDSFPTVRNEFDFLLDGAVKYLTKPVPKVVVLCGSTRFEKEFIETAKQEGLAGNIVLSVVMFGHKEGLDMDGPVKKALDELHLRKIDACDEVVVISPGGYIGQSTRREIEYAQILGRPVRYLVFTKEAE